MGKLIGRGNYGKVYHVTNKLTGEEFAMKQISKEQVFSKSLSMKSLVREFEIAEGTFGHPSIISTYELLHDYKNFYMVNELAEHGDLSTCMQEMSITSDQTQSIARQLFTALSYLHS